MSSILAPVANKISFEQCKLVNLSKSPSVFFEMLPSDWQESLLPAWDELAPISEVMGIMCDDVLIGGGILISSHSQETDSYSDLATFYYASGHLYIGYLWVAESHRGLNLGAFWLKEVANHFPQNSFWLSIVDPALGTFYERNGFRLTYELDLETGREWVYALTR
jgi:GNAT superfamily N-acetyltransferase